MNYQIEITEDMIDTIIIDQLAASRQQFLKDLGANSHVFEWDNQEEDDKKIQQHIDALDLVIKWFARPEQLDKIYGDAEDDSCVS